MDKVEELHEMLKDIDKDNVLTNKLNEIAEIIQNLQSHLIKKDNEVNDLRSKLKEHTTREELLSSMIKGVTDYF